MNWNEIWYVGILKIIIPTDSNAEMYTYILRIHTSIYSGSLKYSPEASLSFEDKPSLSEKGA